MTNGDRLVVAYTMSRFPKLSETFVVDEMLAMEAQGLDVEVFPLIRERESVQQPDAAGLVARARFQPALSWAILRSTIFWLSSHPILLLRTVGEALLGVAGSLSFTLGLLGLLPKTLHNARTMQSLGVSHLHAHFAHHPALSAMVIHRLTGIPFSFTGHGHDVQVDRRMLCRKIRSASFVVAVSEHNRDLMTGSCLDLAPKVRVLHTGVDPSAIAPRQATPWAEAQWPADGLRILAVGRLEEVKGHSVLLAAIAELASAGTAVQAIVVGDGPRRRALEHASAELNLGDRLSLPGPMTRDRVLDLMSSADVVVAPSVPTADGRIEGIPVVLMEAMSLGAAVVASDLPGMRELLPEAGAGVIVPAGDASALAAALARLGLDPRHRAELGRAARVRILDAFDARATSAALASLFRSAAAGGQPPGADAP